MTGAHFHPPSGPAAPHVRRAVLAVLVPLIVMTIVGVIALWPSGDPPSVEAGVRADATILAIQPCPGDPTASHDDRGSGAAAGECRQATVRVESGPDAGVEAPVPVPSGAGAPEFTVGDDVVLGGRPDAPLDSRYEMLDFQREGSLLWLAAAFAIAVVLLSGWRGFAALAGLSVTMLVLAFFLLPALLTGGDPLAVAVTGAAVIMIVTLYLAHGVSVRTSVALVGTLVSLVLTGVLGALMTALGRFTGLGGEGAAYLGAVTTEVDLRGLLLAGLVIGALGVLDDVTVTQTAAVWELAAADPAASRSSLFAAGLRIGREHVAATVNTLVLAYVGASLPLLMLFTVVDQDIGDTVTREVVAQEVVRSLVGGLGIIAAVPVTTALAVLAVRSGTGRHHGAGLRRQDRGGRRAARRPRRVEANN